MAIKKVAKLNRSKIMSILTLITLLTTFSVFGISITDARPSSNMTPMASSEPYLVNKVYNFTTNKDYVNFSNNIFFEHLYIYNIYIEIVTPHSCHMNISLWDPEGDKYDIYDSRDLGIQLEQFQYREIPFGVAITGNYTITFKAHLDRNLNIHIKIINSGLLCLQDALPPSAFSEKEFYAVNKFYNNTIRNHNITLKTDVLYRFYFGRYSSIAYLSKSNTTITYNITSSIDIEYVIYVDDSLPSVTIVDSFDFGTSVEGLYFFNITINCKVLCVNIAYAIVEVEKIADGTNPNDPVPPPDDDNETTNNTLSGIRFFIPPELTIGVVLGIGALVGIPVLIIVLRRKKNTSSL